MKKLINIIFGFYFIFNASLSEAATTCGINATGLYFGAINPLSLTDITSIGAINLTCVGDPVTYIIKASQGNGSMLQRVMKNGLNVLNYNIFTSNSHTTVLGDGTAGSLAINGASNTDSTTATYFAFGKISNIGLSSTVTGTYTDNISVTISY